MVQELGETSQEMMRADDKEVQAILSRRPTGHYWVVIHHKKINKRMTTGEYVLVRVVKDYDTKPQPLLGTIILEVNNGEVVDCQVNVHDMPIDILRVRPFLGDEIAPAVQKKRGDISRAYVYNNL